MTTPIERLSGLKIGTIESVSSNQFKVILELDAPQSTAINAGVPTTFPRVNSYVLIPTEGSCIVGMIVWIGIELSAYPKRRGLKDFDLVDLPFPLRRVTITPVGTLHRRRRLSNDGYDSHLDRGVHAFPSVGDSVLLPSNEQLKSIIESQGKDRRLVIGRSTLSTDATVSVDPDKLFGRHLAVLGNTGSGKSCSVAGLIRWSLEAAAKARLEGNKTGNCNARFIVLDPNGEYGKAFDDMGQAIRRLRVIPHGTPNTTDPTEPQWEPLKVPAWLWNSHEWCSFASASPGVQRPLLLQGLRNMRAGEVIKDNKALNGLRLFGSYRRMLESKIADGAPSYADFPGCKNVGLLFMKIAEDAIAYSQAVDDEFASLQTVTTQVAESHDSSYTDRNGEYKVGFNPFGETDLRKICESLTVVVEKCKTTAGEGAALIRAREDAPIPFEVEGMAEHIKQLAVELGSANAGQFADFLSMRIEMTLNDGRMRPVINPEVMPTLVEWLTEHIGDDGAANGPISIIDLSLVPADVLQMLIAVLGRVVFEVVQRYRRLNGQELPTVIVLEEAHAFVRRTQDDPSGISFASSMCRDTFERIAREGRKFGLGLVLSSQRPSELSQTVLAQCNTFLLHRLMNDRDQEFVKSLIPEKLGGLLSDLPNLPTRQAILLGWATPIPVLVEMRELPVSQRPHSADPDFWDVWTGATQRSIDWQSLADDWTA